MFSKSNMLITEISSKGTIRNVTCSFHNACQEVIEKTDLYKNSSLDSLRVNRSIYGTDYENKPIPNYILDTDEINSYFIIENLAHSIKDEADIIQTSFSNEVTSFGQSSQRDILIFTIVCLCVVIISGVLLLPMMFSIDTNIEESVKCWTLLT